MLFRVWKHFPQSSVAMLVLIVITALNVADVRPAGQHAPKDTGNDRIPLFSVAMSTLMMLYAMAVAKVSSAESKSQLAGSEGTTVLAAARHASSSIVAIAACLLTVSSLMLAVPAAVFGTHTNVWSYSAAFGVIVTVLPETLVQTILLPTGQVLKSKPLRRDAHRQSVDRGMGSFGHSRVSPHAELARSARARKLHKRMDTHRVTAFSSINAFHTFFVLVGVSGATIGVSWAAAFSLCAQLFLPGTLTLAFGGSAAVFFSDSEEDVIPQSHTSNAVLSLRCGRLGVTRAKAALVRLVRLALGKVDKIQERTMWLQYSFPRTPRHIKAAFKREIQVAGIRTNILFILSLSAPITVFSIVVPVAIYLATSRDSPGVVLDLIDSYNFHALYCMAQLSGMVVTQYFGTQYDSALFRAAVNAAESEKDNSTSLLRWLSHECRSPVAAAALAVDEIVQEDLPTLHKLLLLPLPRGEQGTAATGPQRLPPQLHSQQAFSRLASSVQMVQQPIKSLASVLDNMLQYLRRQRKKPAIEQLLYINVAQAWRTAWTNACASRDVEVSAISDAQPQVYFSGPAPVPRHGAVQVLSGLEAMQQLLQLEAITTVSQATLLQVLTNYATNALKYGHGGAASARIELRVSVHHGTGGGGSTGVHASHMRAARGWLTQTLRRDWRKQQQQQQHAPGVPPPMPVAVSALSAAVQASDGLVSSSCSFTTGSSQRSLFAGRTSHAVILPRRRVAAPLASQGSAVQLQDAADAGATAVDAGTSDAPLLSPAVIDVSIVDHGAGLDAAELESLFHPFARLDSGAAAAGNGLGLWLMRQLVESQGGTVSAHSGGKATGCRFSLAFPALLPVPHRQRSGSGTGGGVLVDAVMSGGGTHMLHEWAGAMGGDGGGGGLFGDGEGGAVIRHSHSCPQMPEPDSSAPTLVSVGAAPLGSVVVSIPSHVPLVQPLSKSPRTSSSADRRLSVLRALYEESESKSDSLNPSGGATSESNAVEYTSAHTCTSAASPSAAWPAKLQAYSPDDSRKRDERGSTAQPLRVLLVEDAVSIRTMLQRQLKRLGHTVDVAFDGRDGLDKWLHAARGGRHTAYDAVVTDMTMPRMNGDEMVRQIHLVCAGAAVAGAAGVDGAEAEVPRAPSPPPHHTSTGSVRGIQEGSNREAREEAPDTLHVPLLIGVTGNVLPEDISHFKRCGARVVLTKPASGRDVHEVLTSAAANA